MLGNMVTVGNRAADVGCDHGFLSIWLVQAGISSRVFAMDVRKGPLDAAKKHIEAYGLGDYIETRLSDGLQGLTGWEADTVICAGMGGRLMERILTEGREKVKGLKELILQPQSELWEFRAFLRREGFVLLKEDAVCEEGKYYFAMKVRPPLALKTAETEEKEPVEQRVCDRFGEKLLEGRHPVLQRYLLQRREKLTLLADTLERGKSERGQERRRELLLELADLEYALRRMSTDL